MGCPSLGFLAAWWLGSTAPFRCVWFSIEGFGMVLWDWGIVVIVWGIEGFHVGDSMATEVESREWRGEIVVIRFLFSLFLILFLTSKIAFFSIHFKKKKIRPSVCVLVLYEVL